MRILMATGGSMHSETALWFGTELARLTDQPPTVMAVIENPDDRQEAEMVLERAQTILQRSIPEVFAIIRVGKPDEAILEEAGNGNYDLLVIGERQFHGMRTRVFGSVAKRVLQGASCSVLIAKGRVETIERLLICDSGARHPSLLGSIQRQGLDALLSSSHDITVLHVMSQISAGPGVGGAPLRADIDELIARQEPEGELLQQSLDILSQYAVMPDLEVRHGFVVDEILAESQAGDHDLIIVGARREEGWQRILLDDIAARVAAKIDRPILIVRQG